MSTSVQNLAGSGSSASLPPIFDKSASMDRCSAAFEYSEALQVAASLFESMGDAGLPGKVPPALDRPELDLKSGVMEPALFNQDGAPALSPPGFAETRWLGLTPEALMMLVDAMRSEANDTLVNGQTNAAAQETKLRVDKYEEAQQKKIKEFQEACAAYANRSGWAKFFGGVLKVLGPTALVVGFFANFATGGLMTPLLLGLLVLNLSGTALSAAGISLSDKVSGAVSDLLGILGVPKETAEKIGNIAAGCTAIIDPSGLGKALRGAGELLGVSAETAGKLEMIGTIVAVAALTLLTILLTFGTGALNAASTASSKLANMAGRLAGIARDLLSKVGYASGIAKAANGARLALNGATATIGIGSTGLNMAVADAQMDISSAQADRRLLQRLVDNVRQELGLVQDAMKRDLDFMVKNLKASADMVTQYSQFTIERGQNLGAPV